MIKKSFAEKKELPNSLHEKAMLLFKEYMLIGGMPQSLSVYIESNKDFEKADKEKRDILSLYRNPIEVKSGKNYSTVSIERFVEKYKDRIDIAYVIHPKNLKYLNEKIICIPSYMTFCL